MSSKLMSAVLATLVLMASAAAYPATACGKNYAAYRPTASCRNSAPPAASQPAAKQTRTYCICTPDNDGSFRVRGVTDNADKALRAAEILQAEGIQAWAMEMKPVEAKAGGLTLTNGEAAIAIAYNIGKGKVRAAAIGQSGLAEAIAQP